MKASSSSSARLRQSTGSSSGSPVAPAQARAFLSLFRSFAPSPLAPPSIRTLADLANALPHAQVLSALDETAFNLKSLKSPPRSAKGQDADWVSQFNGLRRVHRALVAYGGGPEGHEWSKVKLDLAKMSKGSEDEILNFCRVMFSVAIQATPGNELLISKIQTLGQQDQQALMVALEPYLPKAPSSSTSTPPSGRTSETAPKDVDEDFMADERKRLLTDNQSLEEALARLASENEALQAQLEEARSGRRSSSVADEQEGSPLAQEVERLRSELRQSEDNLTEADTALDRQTRAVENMTKRIEELNSIAKENDKLKDQLDELKHASDRLLKSEAANKKLSLKLSEAADLKRQLKSAEEENARLVDRNAVMEEGNRKGGSVRELADSYKAQVGALEKVDRDRSKEMTELRFTLEQTQSLLAQADAELAVQRAEVELTRDRIQEFELGGSPVLGTDGGRGRSASEDVGGGEDVEMGGGIEGQTKTELKLQIRRLERDLAAAQSSQPGDNSRLAILESLLDDAKRAKERYEKEYLEEHKLLLGARVEMEKIRSGKGVDSGEEAMALRIRLNESVKELDALKKAHAKLEVQSSVLQKELSVATADLNLVNKDQIDVLRSLRASVNEDKAQLEKEAQDLKDKLRESNEKERLQMEQINGLLMEKVGMQGDTISQREAQLKRERDFGDLRVSLAGRDLPEDVKSRIVGMQDEVVSLTAQLKAVCDKLRASEDHVQKAKKFIREQDTMLKDARRQREAGAGDSFAEAQRSYESEIAAQKADIKRHTANLKELDARYRHEFLLVFAAYQDLGSKMQREHLRGERRDVQPSSWLAQQRKKLGGGLQRS